MNLLRNLNFKILKLSGYLAPVVLATVLYMFFKLYIMYPPY